MANSPESNSLESNITESSSNVSLNSRTVDVHPLAFTIEFNDQKVDEARKSKVHERLSAFSLKHRRNPSLPDFGAVKGVKVPPPIEKLQLNPQHVPIIHSKGGSRPGKPSGTTILSTTPTENQWKSSVLKAVKNNELKSPVILRSLEVNGSGGNVRENFLRHMKSGRRNSLNDIDSGRIPGQTEMPNNFECKTIRNGSGGLERNPDLENKSDTVSEAGTYTVDKDDESPEKEGERTQILVGEDDENPDDPEAEDERKKTYRSSWINDWVRDVEEQNKKNPGMKESPSAVISKSSGSGHSSPGASKIPSPINTLGRKAKLRATKPGDSFPAKLNGSILHRRSSSLSAKDYNDNHGSESSLETESYLRATESVVAAMQNRMRLSIDSRNASAGPIEYRKTDKRDFNYKERPHPPSTASDTDTNSETDAKTFKKPTGNPFTAARLNRAFSSLRRPKTNVDHDFSKKKTGLNGKESTGSNHMRSSPKPVSSKPPSTPFSRTDCGRFSMRSTVSSVRSNASNQSQKKGDSKKQNGSNNNRSASSLSSREVEFQNWRRRKSFDPMKAAAEGRKKEAAKKAAMNQSAMTQSVNLGNGTRNRGIGANPVLRSASFHSTAQAFGAADDDDREFQDQGSTDDQEESRTSSFGSNHHSLLYNSPTQVCGRCSLISRAPICTSRCSLVSETHSSPSRRLRSDDLDSLVMTAISDLSHKLKLKSCNILKKLNYLYDPNDEKSFRLRDEIAVLENRRSSTKNSPIHNAASRDLSAILKNLKGLENVLKVIDDVLFDENLEIYANE